MCISQKGLSFIDLKRRIGVAEATMAKLSLRIREEKCRIIHHIHGLKTIGKQTCKELYERK